MDEKKKGVPDFGKGIILGISTVIVFNFVFLGFANAKKKIKIEENVFSGTTEKMTEIYDILDAYYVNNYDKKLMTETMYEGFLYGVGDPYTSYMSKNDYKSFMDQTEGRYAGLGITVTPSDEDNSIIIVSLFEGAPGHKSGLQPGDKILKVNNTEVTGSAYEDAVGMMKGLENTTVNLLISRPSTNKIFDVDILREIIDIPTVFHRMLPDNMGYIRISAFDRVTYDQFRMAYEDLGSQNMQALVIDVRNNPGGLLDVVNKIADMLIPEGLIVYTEDKNGNKEQAVSDANRIEVPLAILINGNSASASEVLSGAIKDTGVGILVGEKTFGKGLVQNLIRLPDGSAVKVTIAKYYTPSGVCIDGIGLDPDFVEVMDKEKIYRIPELALSEDNQLQKALNVLKTQISSNK